MGLPVVSVASGGLPIVESTVGGTPVTEAANGRGVAVTKVTGGKPGLPVVFETIGVGGGTLAPPLDAVASVTGAWSLSRNMLTSFGAARYTKTGSAITALNDQSGSSRNLTDGGTTSRRPTEITAFPNAVLSAGFDGVANYLQGTAMSDFLTVSSGAIVVSLIINAVTINDATSYRNHGIIADPNGQYIGIFAAASSGVTFYAFNYPAGATQTSLTGAVGVPYVLMWRHYGGNLYFSINGGTEVSVPSGNTSNQVSPLTMGWGSVLQYCNMKVAEVFTTSDGSQTAALAAAIANMKTYVGA